LCGSSIEIFTMKLVGLFVGCGAVVAIGDLERVRTKVPRPEYKADHHHRIGKVLNAHLEKAHPNTKNCNQFSASELQQLQAELHAHVEESHNEIYESVRDTRALRFENLEGYKVHWDEMNKHASTHPRVEEMQRDGHCLEVVMWWVHHLSQAKREELSHLVIPRMPLQRWREPTPEEGVAAAAVYGSSYNPSSTCLSCHGGGLPWQNPENEPPPLPRQVNGKDRQRRCDEYYSEEDGKCGPCDGMAGSYYGDMPDFGIYVDDCEVVSVDVPEDQRATNKWPAKFAVEMRGADRWPRASPSSNATCNFTTDCSEYNKDAEGQPLPPSVPYHWYASIHGLLYVDHNPGQFGGGRLRHESVYEFPSGEEGARRALSGRFGDRNVHLTEIHVQTPEMAAVGDPGVMLNLDHKDMTDANASGIDDSKLDWRRIPSDDGTCVCVPDPAGLPYFEGAYSNATYLGRIKFTPPWQNTGEWGPPGKKVVADHWVKWTFHMMVDIETQKPVMFSSPYGGCATYGNWSVPDDMWPEWTENPARENCFDVTQTDSCKPFVGSTQITV
jgi:hypothetical protein